MLRSGENIVDGVAVDVRRKRIRRINIRVGEDGRVHLSVPIWWATMAEGEEFLLSKWKWVLKTRAELASLRERARLPARDEEFAALEAVIGELMVLWTRKLRERDVVWGMRSMKTLWGSCNYRRRKITYSSALVRMPRELVEYVVVHELTHLQVHDHGAEFKALMDDRLPGWRELRRTLNRRGSAPAERPTGYRQAYFAFS